MKLPHEVFKDSLENWNKKFPNIRAATQTTGELEEYIKSSQLSLLLSVKEMVESTKHKNLQAMEKGSEFMTPRMYRALGHNQALQDLQSLLDEEINKVKEL